MTANRWSQVRYQALTVPWEGIKQSGNQALITSACMYAGAMFGMQHNVFPVWIAVPLAIGCEWTYLSGISIAGKIRGSVWAWCINVTALLTSLVFGMLYILGLYGVIPEYPDPLLAGGLALAHILPLTLLSFFYAMTQRAKQAQSLSDAAALATRQQEQADRTREREEAWRDQQAVLETRKGQLELDRLERRMAAPVAPRAAVKRHACPYCGAALSAGQVGMAKRYSRCKQCPPTA